MTQVDRRTMIKGAAAGAAAAALPVMAKTPRRRPNFLFIMADDMGYADLSCYGREEYRTPAIDKLAAQGSRFLQAYANSAVCTATRVGLITGRYQYRVPIGREEPLTNRPVGLPPEHPTLPSQLRRAGYATSLIGSGTWARCPSMAPSRVDTNGFGAFEGAGSIIFRTRLAASTICGPAMSRSTRQAI